MVKIASLLSVLQDDNSVEVLSADFSNKLLRFLEQPEEKLKKNSKALAQLITHLLSGTINNNALQVALLAKYSARWLPLLLSFPQKVREITESAIKMLSEQEGDVAVAAGIFLTNMTSSYPKKAKNCFALLLKTFRRLSSSSSQQSIQRSKAVAAVIFEIAKTHQELFYQGALLGLRSAVLKVTKSTKSQSLFLYIRALFRELILWTDYILRQKPRQAVVKTAIVPLILKINEYLESTLSTLEFTPMFIELRRATVDLAKEYKIYYPTRRTTAKILIGLQNAQNSDRFTNATSHLDIRLSKVERRSSQVARILRDKLMKSLQSEPSSGIFSPCLSANTLDGQSWRDAGLWKSMQDKFNVAAKKVVDDQLSPMAIINNKQ